MGIVGACDLAVASETASFAFTEARIGVAPAMISLTTQDLLTPRAAARYYLTGATSARTRRSRPASSRSRPLTKTSTPGWDGSWMRWETSPQGAAETKRLLTRGRRQRLAEESSAMAELSARLFASAEAQEGIHAFLEKRPPAWRVPRG